MRQNQKGNDKEFLITDKLLETGKEENQRNIHVSAVRDPWIDRDHSKECSVNSPFDQYQYTIPISPSAFKYIFEENYYNCRMNKNSRLSITCPHNLALLSNIYSGATDEISMKSKMNYSDDDGYSSAQTSSTTCTAAVQHSTTNTIYIPYSTKLFYQIRKRSRSFQHFNNSQQSHLVSLEETTNYLLNLSS
ncbi:hypothetical protein SNEBB_006307 [Seison nebaliae]|nr:hypothetical protein SNEBB_006307 [Seison nebaliae]